MKDGRIASASDDISIKIFSTLLGYCHMITISEFSNSVSSICQLDNEAIVAGSYDHSIRIFQISTFTYKCLATIRNGHSNWINKVISLQSNKFASSSDEQTIKFWEFGINHPIKVIKTKDIIISMKLINNIFIYGSAKSISCYNLEIGQCVTNYKVKCSGSNSIYFNENLYVTGENEIAIIDIEKRKIEIIEIPNSGKLFSIVKQENK